MLETAQGKDNSKWKIKIEIIDFSVYLSAISTLQHCFPLKRNSVTWKQNIAASTSTVHTLILSRDYQEAK